MSDPPNEESPPGSEPSTARPANDTDEPAEIATDRPENTIEPATQRTPERPHQPSAADENGRTEYHTASSRPPTAMVDENDPKASDVDSKWWYCVAAVPIYVVAGLVAGVFATVLFVAGVAVDVSGGMGIASGAVIVAILLGTVVYGLAGIALSVLFPIGIYLDAKTLASADVSWDPDPVLYLLVAVASVLLTVFTLSVVLALYYLYRRNKAVGIP